VQNEFFDLLKFCLLGTRASSGLPPNHIHPISNECGTALPPYHIRLISNKCGTAPLPPFLSPSPLSLGVLYGPYASVSNAHPAFRHVGKVRTIVKCTYYLGGSRGSCSAVVAHAPQSWLMQLCRGSCSSVVAHAAQLSCSS